MKWYKHYSDAHSNLKLQQVIIEFGMEGYGFWWVCVELIAQQGVSFRIKSEKKWKKALEYTSKLTEKRIDEILEFFASIKLINDKSLKNGDLYVPKLSEYGDEYTNKVRRVSGQAPDNVRLDKKRLEETRLDKSTSSKNYLKDISLTELTELSEKYKISEYGIRNKAAELLLYCDSKGKTYKNYRAFLENALRRDQLRMQRDYPLPKKTSPPEPEGPRISTERWEALKKEKGNIGAKLKVTT